MNLEIEKARQKSDLIEEILSQPHSQHFKCFKDFNGDEAPSKDPSNYKTYKNYKEVDAFFFDQNGVWKGQCNKNGEPDGKGMFEFNFYDYTKAYYEGTVVGGMMEGLIKVVDPVDKHVSLFEEYWIGAHKMLTLIAIYEYDGSLKKFGGNEKNMITKEFVKKGIWMGKQYRHDDFYCRFEYADDG